MTGSFPSCQHNTDYIVKDETYSLDICLLLASTSEWLANTDTWKVLTMIHLSKSIQVTGQTEPHTS